MKKTKRGERERETQRERKEGKEREEVEKGDTETKQGSEEEDGLEMGLLVKALIYVIFAIAGSCSEQERQQQD